MQDCVHVCEVTQGHNDGRTLRGFSLNCSTHHHAHLLQRFRACTNTVLAVVGVDGKAPVHPSPRATFGRGRERERESLLYIYICFGWYMQICSTIRRVHKPRSLSAASSSFVRQNMCRMCRFHRHRCQRISNERISHPFGSRKSPLPSSKQNWGGGGHRSLHRQHIRDLWRTEMNLLCVRRERSA